MYEYASTRIHALFEDGFNNIGFLVPPISYYGYKARERITYTCIRMERSRGNGWEREKKTAIQNVIKGVG